MKYLLMSDTHYHLWSAFSTVLSDSGVNSRLQILINATKYGVEEAKRQGCEAMIIAGDLFHVRGSLSPSVLNPILDMFEEIIESGMAVYALAGNHDLESNDAKDLTNSATSLRKVGVKVINESTCIEHLNVVMVPWHSKSSELLAEIDRCGRSMSERGLDAGDFDLIIHAPVNGVIYGIPDHGLDAETLSKVGFKRVFSGHYHNHKWLNEKVCSIGALTHQTWGDVGSKAGFMIVGDECEHYETLAPKFIDADELVDESQVVGNYVRAKIVVEAESEIEELREKLFDAGAAGVVIMPQRKIKSVERTVSSSKIDSLNESIGSYCKTAFEDYWEDVSRAAAEVLSRVEKV